MIEGLSVSPMHSWLFGIMVMMPGRWSVTLKLRSQGGPF